MAELSRPRRRLRWLAQLTVALLLALPIALGQAGIAAADQDGRAIKGGTDANTAQSISVGDWVDELGAGGSDQGVRVYAVERGQAMGGVSVAVSMSPQEGVEDEIAVKLSIGAEVCDSDSAQAYRTQPLLNVIAEDSARTSSSEACKSSDRMFVTITRAIGTDVRKIRVRVIQTPAVADAKNYRAPKDAGSSPSLNLSSPVDLAPGTWLSTAAEVDSGTTYSSSLSLNQRGTYRIGVRWGQRVAWRVVFPEASPSVREQIEQHKITAHVYLLNPLGASNLVDEAYSLGRGSEVSGHTPMVTAYNSSQFNNMQGQYVVALQLLGPDGVEVSVPYQLMMTVLDEPDPGLGPEVPLDGPRGSDIGGTDQLIAYGLVALGAVMIGFGGLVVYASSRRP